MRQVIERCLSFFFPAKQVPILCTSAAEQVVADQQKEQDQDDTPEDVRDDQADQNADGDAAQGVADQFAHEDPAGAFL